MSFVQQVSGGARWSAGPSSEPPGRFLYCYVTENGRETEDQDMAEVDIGQTSEVSYLVKCRTSDLQKFEKKHTMARGKSSSGILNFECYQLPFTLYFFYFTPTKSALKNNLPEYWFFTQVSV